MATRTPRPLASLLGGTVQLSMPGTILKLTPTAPPLATWPVDRPRFLAQRRDAPNVAPCLAPLRIPTPADVLATAFLPPPAPMEMPEPEETPEPEAEACAHIEDAEALVDALGPDLVGPCLEKPRDDPRDGNLVQRTAGGLLVWLWDEDLAVFTDGATTWYGCPDGPQRRPAGAAASCPYDNS